MAFSNYYKMVCVSSADQFDGTDIMAATLVEDYPGIISVQSAETEDTGDAVLALIDHNGEVLNVYADDYIVFNTFTQPNGVKTETTEKWGETDFLTNFMVAVSP